MEETEKNNRIIAQFGGGKSYGDSGWITFNDNPLDNHHISTLKYDSDYNYLMSVVEYIEALGFKFQICRRRVVIIEDGEPKDFSLVVKSEKNKMDAIYRAVLKFAEWYNKENHGS